jgi:phosphoribosylanthranilate isomerase
MKVTRVKVCGMGSKRDVDMAISCGADAVGFITEVPVDTPRKIDLETAATLISSVPYFVDSVLVIMPEDGQQAVDMIDRTKPDVVQLHRSLQVSDLEFIRNNTNIGVIKTFSIPVGTQNVAEELITQINDLIERDLVDGILLDSSTPGKVGGTGKTHDWSISRQIVENVEIPVMLAGGLGPGNVRDAVVSVSPYAVDTVSGIETDGRKDEEKMCRFVKEARCIDDRI